MHAHAHAHTHTYGQTATVLHNKKVEKITVNNTPQEGTAHINTRTNSQPIKTTHACRMEL